MQKTLFNQIDIADPTVKRVDADRLKGQNSKILLRLRRGPATNAELSMLSLRYSARIHDLREAGIKIKATRLTGGIWSYEIAEDSNR